MINYGKQSINQSDIKEVVRVLKKEFLTQGPTIKIFEHQLKKFFGFKHCAVVSNGTAALYIAAKSLEWKEKDHIITTPNTFVATANCILHVGAKPEFVDIDKDTYTIDVEKVEDRLKKLNGKVKAIIAVDYAGHPCDWKSLKFLSKKYNLKLINDNCHALGAKINGDMKYASKYADIVTHSYHPVKTITTGEGGSIFTNDAKLYKKFVLYRNNGIVKNKNFSPWEYKVKELSMNFRLSDIQCALGISQLKRLNKFVLKRNEIAKYYSKKFESISNLKVPKVKNNFYHAFHLYPLLIDFHKTKINKKNFFLKLKKKGINLQVHYIPLHHHPVLKKFSNKKDLLCVEQFYKKEVSLPIYPDLKLFEIKKVINEVINLIYKK